jgi:hypothetical protein
MRRYRLMMILAGTAAVWWAAAPALAAAASPDGGWHNAIEVPGSGSLNRGGSAIVNSVSCGSPGNCAAGGFYSDVDGADKAFVVSETRGTWGRAIEVPGTGKTPGQAAVNAASCASAGNCVAGGYYPVGPTGDLQAFVVDETRGTWGQAIELPGSATLNKGGDAEVTSVSCASPGNCVAGGYYTDQAARQQAFVADETHGTWGQAIEVPGSGALNVGGLGQVDSVSCASAGNCGVVGYYLDQARDGQAFVVSETGGTWGTAVEVPGLGTLNLGGYAYAASVSCRSAGNCAAGGFYSSDSSGQQQAFVVTESHGIWDHAVEVPGSGALNTGGLAGVNSVSCGSAGNCVAGGQYLPGTTGGVPLQAFVVTESHGIWGQAIKEPGPDAQVPGDLIQSVSCASAGKCLAGGQYTDGAGHEQAFVISETRGTWGRAIEVPGSGTLNKGGDAEVTSVSCASPGHCAAGGYYAFKKPSAGDQFLYLQAFVASES